MPSNDQDSEVTGVLLAGGRSARMGGSEKALIEIAGKPMLAHVIARFAPQVSRLVLNANGDPARFAQLRLPVIADTVEGYAGPLAGLHAGLLWALRETPRTRFVASVPADTPYLPGDLVARLLAELRERSACCAIASSSGRRHPVVGVWDVALIDRVTGALQQNVRAMHQFAETQKAAVVDFAFIEVAGVTVDPFFNVNTPADVEKARTLLSGSAHPTRRP
jgi:molybdopterin-guanine dinucleotide biosynthesis protein A